MPSSPGGKTSFLSTKSPKFHYDVLALLLRDSIACKTATEHIPEDFFEDEGNLDIIFQALREFVFSYKSKPKKDEIKSIIEEEAKSVKLSDSKLQDILETLDDLWEHDDFTPSYVKDTLYDSIIIHKMTQAVDDIPSLLDKGDYDSIVSSVMKARSAIIEEGDMKEFWSDSEERMRRRSKAVTSRAVPTGFDGLDVLLNGGLPKGKIGMFVGSTGRGKSAVLVNCCAQAVLQGNDALFLTYELDTEDVMTRIDSHMTEIPLNELPLKKKTCLKRLKELSKQHDPGRLFVRYVPTKTETIDGVRSVLERLRVEEGFTPDVVYLDYFDLLRMVSTTRDSKKWDLLEENMEFLRGLAGEYNTAIWTASQTNRGGFSKELVDMDDLSGAYGKAFSLDLLITISQDKREKALELFRFYIAKSRLSQQGETFWVAPNFSNMRMRMLTENEVNQHSLVPTGSASMGPRKKKNPGRNVGYGVGSHIT